VKIIKKTVVFLILVLVGIQWIPPAQNRSTINPEMDFLRVYNATDSLTSLFKTSCYDCHSNKTTYPWYSKIQPIRFIMDKHIKNGKKELNFNEFVNYSSRRQKSKLKSILSQLNDYKMPLKSYELIHKDARLTEDERKLMIEWVSKIKDSLEK